MDKDTLQLKPFTLADIEEAAQLTYATWGDELQADEQVKQVLYEAMVRYYYRNGDYSYKVVDAQGMQGFLLAGLPENGPYKGAWLQEAGRCLACSEQRLLDGYHDYLAYNALQLEKYVEQDALLLHLFLSRRPGCGQKLLQQLVELAAAAQRGSMLLWSDETCDYAYYRKNGFQQLAKFSNSKSAELGKLQTLIYKKII